MNAELKYYQNLKRKLFAKDNLGSSESAYQLKVVNILFRKYNTPGTQIIMDIQTDTTSSDTTLEGAVNSAHSDTGTLDIT